MMRINTPTFAWPSRTLENAEVIGAVQAYLAGLQGGRPMDRHRLLEIFPDLAVTLAECLDGLECLLLVAPRLRHLLAGRAQPGTNRYRQWLRSGAPLPKRRRVDPPAAGRS
jgi:hypothetical protein